MLQNGQIRWFLERIVKTAKVLSSIMSHARIFIDNFHCFFNINFI